MLTRCSRQIEAFAPKRLSSRALRTSKSLINFAIGGFYWKGEGIGFSKMMKTCTAVFIVAVLMRTGFHPSAVFVARVVSIVGAVSLMIW